MRTYVSAVVRRDVTELPELIALESFDEVPM